MDAVAVVVVGSVDSAVLVLIEGSTKTLGTNPMNNSNLKSLRRVWLIQPITLRLLRPIRMDGLRPILRR